MLLCSPLRPVRVATADNLQVSLVTYSENILKGPVDDPEERVEKCSTLIQDTDWGDSVTKLREVRNQICLLLDVKPPAYSVGK